MSTLQLSERDLEEACLADKRQAQEALYQRYSRKMMGVCLRYATDRMEAEDILQMGFVKVFGHLDTFRGGSLEGWIRRIFVREAINHYHKRKRRPLDLVEELPVGSAKSSDEPLSQLSAKEIMDMVNLLPEGARIIFSLFAIEGYPHAEIAEMLHISEGTSKSQYARARQLLRERILAS